MKHEMALKCVLIIFAYVAGIKLFLKNYLSSYLDRIENKKYTLLQ